MVINLSTKRRYKMSTFIHRLWRGEITPCSSPTANAPAISRLLALQERHRMKLFSTMTDEQKSDFEKYEAAAEETLCLTEEDAFTEGIRFSLRLFTEAL